MDILKRLLNLAPTEIDMELPPKVFIDMEGEFLEFIEGEKLVVRFPNKKKYSNPFGFMQGGIIVAAIDNTVSPLSYVSAPASLTREICTTYKRPIREEDKYIDVIATIGEITQSSITLLAKVVNKNGKLVAKAVSKCVFVR